MKANDHFETGTDQLESWKVPDKYFDSLEDKVIQQWRADNPKTNKNPLLRWLWVPLGVAASFLMMIFVWDTEEISPEMVLNDEELSYYYLYTSDEEEVDDLWYDFSDLEIDDLEEWLTNEDFNIETLNELY